jgi:hypothetical protein
MHTIFVGGIATGRFTMGSNEPLGTASLPAEYGTNSQESNTIIIDGPDKAISGTTSWRKEEEEWSVGG